MDAAGVLLVDPTLAAGHRAAAAASQLKAVGAQRLIFLCIIAAPEGYENFHRLHTDIPVFRAALDNGLTPAAFITMGLGDAGDRYFGTF